MFDKYPVCLTEIELCFGGHLCREQNITEQEKERIKCQFPVLRQHRARLGGVRQAGRIPVLRKERWQRYLLIFQWAGLGFGKREALCKGRGLAKYLIIYCLICLYISLYIPLFLKVCNWRGSLVQVRYSFYWGRVVVKGAEGKSSIYLFFCWAEKILWFLGLSSTNQKWCWTKAT